MSHHAHLTDQIFGENTERLVKSERTPITYEAHVMAPGGQCIAMYRYRQGKWQFRPGYGESWETCAKPDLSPGAVRALVSGVTA